MGGTTSASEAIAESKAAQPLPTHNPHPPAPRVGETQVAETPTRNPHPESVSNEPAAQAWQRRQDQQDSDRKTRARQEKERQEKERQEKERQESQRLDSATQQAQQAQQAQAEQAGRLESEMHHLQTRATSPTPQSAQPAPVQPAQAQPAQAQPTQPQPTQALAQASIPLSAEEQARTAKLVQTMAGHGNPSDLIDILVTHKREFPNQFDAYYADLLAQYKAALPEHRHDEYLRFKALADRRLGMNQPALVPQDPQPVADEPPLTLGGENSLGEVLTLDQLDRWLRQRPGEDRVEWVRRTDGWQDHYNEAGGREVYQNSKPTYDALAEESGVSVTRESGTAVTVDFGDGVRVEGADGVGMARLADAMLDDPAMVETVKGVLSGDLDLARITARLEALEALPEGGANRRRALREGEPVLTPDLRAERDRLRIARDAAEMREDGWSDADVTDVLIAGYAPDPRADYELAQDLILDLLPVVGEIRSAQAAAEDFGALTEAVEQGDWTAAAQYGLFGVLATAGAVPGVGKIAKLGRSALMRGLRSVPGAKKYLAAYRLNRGRNQALGEAVAGWKEAFPTASVETVFGDSLNTLPKAQRDHMEGVWPYLIGEAGERNMRQNLEDTGFTQLKDLPDRQFSVLGKGRNYDGVVRQDLKTKFGMFLLPGDYGDAWKGLEMKINQSSHGKQVIPDAWVNAKDDVVAQSRGKPTREVDGVIHFRDRIDQVPFDVLEDTIREILEKKKGVDWTVEQIDQVVARAKEFHTQSSKGTGIPMIVMLTALAAPLGTISMNDPPPTAQ